MPGSRASRPPDRRPPGTAAAFSARPTSRARHRGPLWTTSNPAAESSTSYLTAGGVLVRQVAEEFDAAELADITRQVELRPGGVLSSGMEYPGRYSRWHLAYVDPPVDITARGRTITARALNQRGAVLLPVIAAALARTGEVTGDERQAAGHRCRVG